LKQNTHNLKKKRRKVLQMNTILRTLTLSRSVLLINFKKILLDPGLYKFYIKYFHISALKIFLNLKSKHQQQERILPASI
jgi:hypothetical protein